MSPDGTLVPQPTPEDFPEFVSIPVRVAQHAAAWPDRRAAVCEGRTRTWAEFDRRANRIARALSGMGKQGDAREALRPLAEATPPVEEARDLLHELDAKQKSSPRRAAPGKVAMAHRK